MASLRRFLKSLGGRKAGATRGGTPGSHVNKRTNKRTANKAIRKSYRADLTNIKWEGTVTGRYDSSKETK